MRMKDTSLVRSQRPDFQPSLNKRTFFLALGLRFDFPRPPSLPLPYNFGLLFSIGKFLIDETILKEFIVIFIVKIIPSPAAFLEIVTL